MKKFIFAAVALLVAFAIVGCKDEASPTPQDLVTIDFTTGDLPTTATAVGMPATVQIERDTALGSKFPAKPTAAGYEFLQWVVGTGNNKEQVTATHPTFADDATVRGEWAPEVLDTHWRVHFDGNEGTATPAYIDVLKTASGFGTTFPEAHRTGFKLDGWYSVAATTGGTKLESNTSITATTTYYARWIPAITVTFNYNYSPAAPAPQIFTLASNEELGATNFALIEAPVRTGYNFLGWFPAATGGTAVTITAASKWTTNTVLFARWAEIVIEITITGADGARAIEQDQTLVLTAVVTGDTNTAIGAAGWTVSPTGAGVTVTQDASDPNKATVAANATATVQSYTIQAKHAGSTEVGSFSLTVNYKLNGPVISGGKDAIANLQYVPEGTLIWSLEKELAAWLEANDDELPAPSYERPGNFQTPARPFEQAGNPILNIDGTEENGYGINIHGRTATNYESFDLHLIRARGIDNTNGDSYGNVSAGGTQGEGIEIDEDGTKHQIILRDKRYKITVVGVILAPLGGEFDNPRFGGAGSPYDNISLEEQEGSVGTGIWPVFKATLYTRYNHQWNGVRVYLGESAPSPDIRVTGMYVEYISDFKKCECDSDTAGVRCNLNGESISSAYNQTKFCSCYADAKDCDHGCNVCLVIGPPYAKPADDYSTTYVVPTPANDKEFYIDLNFANLRAATSISGNSEGRPIVRTAANDVTYTFNSNGQLLLLGLTTEQSALIVTNIDKGLKATITGTALQGNKTTVSTVNFRYGFGKDTGSGWNMINLIGDAAFTGITGAKDLTANSDNWGDGSALAYFILQHRAAANTDAKITSIKVSWD